MIYNFFVARCYAFSRRTNDCCRLNRYERPNTRYEWPKTHYERAF